MHLNKALPFVLLSSLTYASVIILTRFIMSDGGDPFTVVLWAFLIESPLWIYLFKKHFREFKTLTSKAIQLLIIRGLINTIGINIIEMFALKFSPATNYAFLYRTVIIFTIVFAAIFLHEKLTRKKIFLALTLLFGSYLLLSKEGVFSFTVGDGFTIIEAAFAAFGNNVVGKKLTQYMHADLASSASFLAGMIPLFFIVVLKSGFHIPQNMGLITLLSLSSIIFTLALFRGYKYASASYVTMILSFTPVFVTIAAFFLFKEILLPIQIIGGIIIITSGVLVHKLRVL
ncbi:hypothetical protein A2690_02870 [Candidatus Roizmanbacteria bacterium RIFCSPHIGHO2_01_FULL_39_12b]|uniref:EamA domain-containing protein n=1 Tax=Candidatus Roizmanbacteria bacterium RIFCSPHIGHO2_01_FULL_39_12b TaxID=1802030 RepID=A0A1F7G7Y7_9BACT|nr:MAG: hypothetical protein A2690_02870 [Candidatus Roizmanbacteria bacterium RIFCSPHIGHO2_01_FULL_39_12b]OGK45924.1 MAG: hypothetical protein A3B46_02685 [Candidatus Roizmanbacteria bacterium RIFCSPLOWO2_01_FULL_39_19]